MDIPRKENVLVFKTNASSATDQAKVKFVLKRINGIKHWNFDLDDCDRIFRTSITEEVDPSILIEALATIGITAKELEDLY